MSKLTLNFEDVKDAKGEVSITCDLALTNKEMAETPYSTFIIMALSEHLEELVRNKKSDFYLIANAAYTMHQESLANN